MATPTWRWRLGCGWVPYQGNRLDGLGLSNDQRGVLVESFAPVRGTMRRPRHRRYRVGAQTINVTSAGLVASAIVVVMEVIAPSSGPPGAFSFPARADHPALPTLPLQVAAPPAAGQQPPFGFPASTSSASATGVAPAVPSRSVASSEGVVPTTAEPAVAQPSGAIATAFERPGNGAGHGSGDDTAVARASVAAAGANPPASPNVTDRSVGNGNAGNGSVGNGAGAGANAQGNGESFKSEPSGQAVTDTLVSPVPVSATAASERDPAPGPEATDPLSREFGPGRPATAGLGAGEGQEGSPAAPPGRSSP